MLPNFIIFGAPKCGTTSLYNYLQQHPQIFLPLKKEPNYFITRDVVKSTAQDYAALFDPVRDEKAVGEASIHYLSSLEAPALIKKKLPDVRLIAILRDPAERIHSEYTFLKSLGSEKSPDLWYAVEKEDRHLRYHGGGWAPRYVRKSLYFEQLRRYYDLFDPKQIKIYLYEDIRDNPKDVVRSAFEFLDVDQTFEVQATYKFNETRVIRNQALDALLTKFGPANSLRKLLKPDPFKPAPEGPSFEAFTYKLYYAIRDFSRVRPQPLSSKDRARLIEIVREDVLQLQALLDRDLSAWLKV
ncbi:MAG: sulfotransferase domain-containing protein [Candidatus Obscuribacterales bacterium]|nr:sulfotransferase domain-containing protein [Candidatus Obscuribacterales bacterium]